MLRRRRLWVAGLAALLVAAAIARVATLSHSANDLLQQPTIRAHGKPDDTEIAIRVRNVYRGRGAVAATCHEPSAVHWTCEVRLANGRTGRVRASWSPRTEKLTVAGSGFLS